MRGSIGGNDEKLKHQLATNLASIDKSLKRQQALAISARQTKERKKQPKLVPWECYIRSKIKKNYPW